MCGLLYESYHTVTAMGTLCVITKLMAVFSAIVQTIVIALVNICMKTNVVDLIIECMHLTFYHVILMLTE